MTVREGQRIGALTLLIASLAVYGGFMFHDRHLLPDPPLPWGDQRPGRIVVEVTGKRGADGIYFLPETAAVAELAKITGSDVPTAEDGSAKALFLSGSALSVSVEGGVLKIADMSAVKRLALGLPIDLNRASEEELLLLPGIGAKMAAQIVQLRRSRGKFEELEELKAIPGIKEKKLRQLEKYLTVGNYDQ